MKMIKNAHIECLHMANHNNKQSIKEGENMNGVFV